jgi:hypothetical protein
MSDTSLSSRRNLRPGSGRRSLGPRVPMTVRCPEPLAEIIKERQIASGLSAQNFMVALLQNAAAAGLWPEPPAEGQERLPLTA